MAFCQHCGNEITDPNAAFCAKCGSKILKPEPEVKASAPVAETPRPVQAQPEARPTKQINITVPDVDLKETFANVKNKTTTLIKNGDSGFFDLKSFALLAAIIFSIFDICLFCGKTLKVTVESLLGTQREVASPFEDGGGGVKAAFVIFYIITLIVAVLGFVLRKKSKGFVIPLLIQTVIKLIAFIIIAVVAGNEVREQSYGLGESGLSGAGVFYIIFMLLTLAACVAFFVLPAKTVFSFNNGAAGSVQPVDPAAGAAQPAVVNRSGSVDAEPVNTADL